VELGHHSTVEASRPFREQTGVHRLVAAARLERVRCAAPGQRRARSDGSHRMRSTQRALWRTIRRGAAADLFRAALGSPLRTLYVRRAECAVRRGHEGTGRSEPDMQARAPGVACHPVRDPRTVGEHAYPVGCI
jgi:hypothetical protein